MLGNSVEHLRQNRLKIITFNYDRSLEHYLYRSFAAVADEEERRVLPDYIGNLGFVHVHGILSRLDWQQGGGRGYGQVQKGEDILAASQSMLLTHQTPQIGYAGVPVAQLIAEARRVIILGFGFDDRNMDKIGLPKSVDSGQSQYAASAMGIKAQRIAQLRSRFQMDTYEDIDKVFDEVIENWNPI